MVEVGVIRDGTDASEHVADVGGKVRRKWRKNWTFEMNKTA